MEKAGLQAACVRFPEHHYQGHLARSRHASEGGEEVSVRGGLGVDTGALNTSVTKTFRTNDLYDPDFTTTIGGDSVQNYSTFINASLYQSWRVYGAKITLTAMNLGSSMAMIVPLLVSYDALVATTGASEATVSNYTAMPSSAEPIYLGPITSGTNVVKSLSTAPLGFALGLSRLPVLY